MRIDVWFTLPFLRAIYGVTTETANCMRTFWRTSLSVHDLRNSRNTAITTQPSQYTHMVQTQGVVYIQTRVILTHMAPHIWHLNARDTHPHTYIHTYYTHSSSACSTCRRSSSADARESAVVESRRSASRCDCPPCSSNRAENVDAVVPASARTPATTPTHARHRVRPS